jgi:hypothetical protein
VAADVEVRFAKVPRRMSFSSGFPSRWLVFWGAQRNKRHGHTEYEGCVTKSSRRAVWSWPSG